MVLVAGLHQELSSAVEVAVVGLWAAVEVLAAVEVWVVAAAADEVGVAARESEQCQQCRMKFQE